MTRSICYITGTRADFGLMRQTLNKVQQHPNLRLSLIVTGMHLSSKFGATGGEVEASGLAILGKVPVAIEGSSGTEMALGIGDMIKGVTTLLEAARPDVVLLLGDRGEMLAAAVAAIHLNIPIAHIHGGERSGTVDEPVRHAISKLSHIHLTATEQARDRLVRLGERPSDIYVVGAPGLSDIHQRETASRADLAHSSNLDEGRRIALFLFHPVLQDETRNRSVSRLIIKQLIANEFQIVALMPNSDAGSDEIREELLDLSADSNLRLITHLPRSRFLNWMAEADLLIGNSSSGIIEAASFGTPVVNVGDRQKLRERNANVIDAAAESEEIGNAIRRAVELGRFPPINLYGDGTAADRIVRILAEKDLSGDLMKKSNAY